MRAQLRRPAAHAAAIRGPVPTALLLVLVTSLASVACSSGGGGGGSGSGTPPGGDALVWGQGSWGAAEWSAVVSLEAGPESSSSHQSSIEPNLPTPKESR